MTDAAIVLSIIAGKDPNDNFTLAQPSVVPDFTKALNKNALKGKRIGVPRRVFLNDSISGNDPFVNVVFEQALATIRGLGATVVDPADLPSADEIANSNNETIVLDIDFKVSVARLGFSCVLVADFIAISRFSSTPTMLRCSRTHLEFAVWLI
jgi:amidase